MAEEKKGVEVESETKNEPKKKQRGMISRIWNGIFRLSGDDFEKRLQYISKEEANVMKRMNHRSLNWRRRLRQLVLLSITLEVIAVSYAIIATRSMDLDWRMRTFKILPMFVIPALSSVIYSMVVSLNKIWERKDQKILEKLRAERQAKIDELKEKTNYYTTQQLIQRYDPDPAAKAAAATVLASKLGADSGLKVYVGDEAELTPKSELSKDVEQVGHSGMRNRKSVQSSASIPKNGQGQSNQSPGEETKYTTQPHGNSNRGTSPLVVEHHDPQASNVNDGGWIARLAAFLVGEDPMNSYALICGNCHIHNGLARKEDYPFITYYCPHCQALNQPKHLSSGANTSDSRPGDAIDSMNEDGGDVALPSSSLNKAEAKILEATE